MIENYFLKQFLKILLSKFILSHLFMVSSMAHLISSVPIISIISLNEVFGIQGHILLTILSPVDTESILSSLALY